MVNGFTYFNAYKDAKIIDFHVISSKNRKDFDEAKYMSFLIKDDELLERYNEI